MYGGAAYAVRYTLETTTLPAHASAKPIADAGDKPRSSAMANFLPPNGQPQLALVARTQPGGSSPGEQLADLKIFWGPEICRLEYLVHLLNTGRIKDEYWLKTA
jgi:hypothetical protein